MSRLYIWVLVALILLTLQGNAILLVNASTYLLAEPGASTAITEEKIDSPAAESGFSVVVNKSNSIEELTFQQLRQLLMGEMRQWPNKHRVTIAQLDSRSGLYRAVIALVVKMTPDDYSRLLLHMEFQGEELLSIKNFQSPSDVCKYVANDPGAIGIVDTTTAERASYVKTIRINGRVTKHKP